MINSLSALMDSVSLINALINNPQPSQQTLERLARNYKHIQVTLEKLEVVNGNEPLTEYTKALDSAAAYFKQHAPQLLS